MKVPAVALRMTPHLTSTPEQRYAVECIAKDAGLSVSCWKVHPGEDPSRPRWAPPSLEVLLDGSELGTQELTAGVRAVIRALAQIRQGRPELPLSVVVELPAALGSSTVRLAFRPSDDHGTIEESAAALTVSLLQESGAAGWDSERPRG